MNMINFILGVLYVLLGYALWPVALLIGIINSVRSSKRWTFYGVCLLIISGMNYILIAYGDLESMQSYIWIGIALTALTGVIILYFGWRKGQIIKEIHRGAYSVAEISMNTNLTEEKTHKLLVRLNRDRQLGNDVYNVMYRTVEPFQYDGPGMAGNYYAVGSEFTKEKEPVVPVKEVPEIKKRIIYCTNCGAKNIIEGSHGECEYCGTTLI